MDVKVLKPEPLQGSGGDLGIPHSLTELCISPNSVFFVILFAQLGVRGGFSYLTLG